MLKKYAPVVFLLIVLISCFSAHAQYLNNPSFENTCGDDFRPTSWDSCTGVPGTFPCGGNPSLAASDGSTYLGLVTKSWGQNEACQQRLVNTLDSNSCYVLMYDVAYSKNLTDSFGNDSLPAKLRFWLSTSSCSYDTLIARDSLSMNDTIWRKDNSITFKAHHNYTYLIIEASSDSANPFHGNVLLDNLRLTDYSTTTQKLDTTVSKGTKVPMIASNGNSYSWSPSTDLTPNGNVQNPTAVVNKSVTYTATITENNGCTKAETFKITLETTIPTVFTPNSDGKNDVFEIQSLPANSDLKIFNRWGQIVFEQTNYNNDWTGKTTGGKDLADGTYYYIVKSASVSKEWKGYVQLIR